MTQIGPQIFLYRYRTARNKIWNDLQGLVGSRVPILSANDYYHLNSWKLKEKNTRAITIWSNLNLSDKWHADNWIGENLIFRSRWGQGR